MKSNVKAVSTFKETTHEGVKASRISPEFQLRRSVSACLLWEDGFYEDGVETAKRIAELIAKVDPTTVAAIAVECRTKQKLRHVPLFIVRQMAKLPSHKHLVADTLFEVIQRADEMAEFIAMYWKDNGGKKTLSSQVKKGLARCFTKFNEYQFGKYKGDGKEVKLRDAMFLCHPTPTKEQKSGRASKIERKYKSRDTAVKVSRHKDGLFHRIANNELATPDTWEVELSAGKDKKQTFERLMEEGKLGALAFIRNLRNMHKSGVDEKLVFKYSTEVKLERVLPFRFITAATAVPKWESMVEAMMLKCLGEHEKMAGKTTILVDNSGSMYGIKVSAKSDLDRSDAACALAILLREVCEHVEVVSFSDRPTIIPGRKGFALRDLIKGSPKGGTNTGDAVKYCNSSGYDRLIIITDEQSHQSIPKPLKGSKGYVLNVDTNKNGIGYGDWVHIDGWSESVVDYIMEYERLADNQ